MNKQTQEALKMAILLLECPHITEGRINVVVDACKEALEQPAQEPVGWFQHSDFRGYSQVQEEYKNDADVVPLYTHPHQWQGLTDDEIIDMYFQANINPQPHGFIIDFIRAIEQALRNKNG